MTMTTERPAQLTRPAPAEKESVTERALRLWDGHPDTTARALLGELLCLPPEEIIDALVPWITDRVRAAVRSEVRHAEKNAWASPDGHPQRTARSIRAQTGALPALDNMELLLSLPVLVPTTGSKTQAVAWRDMTVADHQARIKMLGKKRDALQATISRHEWAIAEIGKYGVRCLGEISLEVLKADMGL